MQVDVFLRKLQPLIPSQVQHWQTIRPLLDSSTRELLDQEIYQRARRILGDFERKILLTLPPPAQARGEFDVGAIVYEKRKWQLGLRRSELLQNIAILGRAGAGKTNLVFHLIKQLLAKHVPVLFLDWKRTARHLLPQLRPRPAILTPGRDIAPFAFNPFETPSTNEAHIYAGQLIDTLAAAFELGEGSKSVLLKILLNEYANGGALTAMSVLKRLESQYASGRAAGWHASATRALQTLALSLPSSQAGEQRRRVNSLLDHSTIIELDGLSESVKAFLVPMLLLWIYRTQLATRKRETLQLVVVIEEAHHVLLRNEQRAKESVLNRLLRQFREIGVGTIIVDQHPHLLSTAALGNTFATICLNQKEPSDINKAAALSLLSDDAKPWLSRLPVGQGIVKMQDRWQEPVLVAFPHVAVDKGSVSDTMLREYVRAKTRSLALPANEHNNGQIRRVQTLDRLVSEDELVFLSDVIMHPNDGVKARYARLKLSAESGTQLYRRLVEAGILDVAVIAMGNTRKTMLRVSAQGRTMFGLDSLSSNESLAHAYWKQHVAHVFRMRRYHVMLEHPRIDGMVDILAMKGKKHIGIEIETGTSDVVRNVRNGLRSHFDRIIVACTDDSALQKAERALAKAGLLFPGRISLVRARTFA